MVFISKVNNYMFRPKTAIFRLSQLQFCSKSVIYIYMCVCLYCIVMVMFIYDYERQCTYNVTMGRVRVTKVAVEKQQLLHILTMRLQLSLSRMQRACTVLYCHLWAVQLCYIFPNYLTNGRIFFWGGGREGRLLNKKCVL